MDTVPHEERLVTLGVDTHADIQVVVALDHLGGMLGPLEIPTTRTGFQRVLEWACELGVIDQVGIEGTGSYGAGLFRWLRARGIRVVRLTDPTASCAVSAARTTSPTPKGPPGRCSPARPPAPRSPRTATSR